MKLLIPLLLPLFVLLAPLNGVAQEAFIIGVQCYNKDCRIVELENIMTEAYARVGLKVRFQYYPPKRVAMEADRGQLDACGVMTATQAQRHNNLTLVNVPLITASLVAFSTSQGRKAGSWKDLEGFTVGTIRGSTLIQDDTLKGIDINRHIFNEARAAFAMLQDGRLDFLLGDITAGTLLTQEMGIQVYPSTPLLTANMYHAVNKKHSQLVPALEKIFEEMKTDGTILKLIGNYKNMLPAQMD